MVALQKVRDAAQLHRIVVHAHVFDPQQRPLFGRVLNLQDVVQQIAERQVVPALVGIGEGAVGEVPEAVAVQDVGVGRVVLGHRRRRHLHVLFVRYRDDTEVRLVLRQQRVLVHHAGDAQVAVVFLPGESELAPPFRCVDQALDVLPQPGERLLIAPYVRDQRLGNRRGRRHPYVEPGVVALQHARLVLPGGDNLARHPEVPQKILDKKGVNGAFRLIIGGAVVDDQNRLLGGALGVRREPENQR